MFRKLSMSALDYQLLPHSPSACRAFAQAQGDQFSSSGNEGQYASQYQGNTGTQTYQERDGSAPTLQGAALGTIDRKAAMPPT